MIEKVLLSFRRYASNSVDLEDELDYLVAQFMEVTDKYQEEDLKSLFRGMRVDINNASTCANIDGGIESVRLAFSKMIGKQAPKLLAATWIYNFRQYVMSARIEDTVNEIVEAIQKVLDELEDVAEVALTGITLSPTSVSIALADKATPVEVTVQPTPSNATIPQGFKIEGTVSPITITTNGNTVSVNAVNATEAVSGTVKVISIDYPSVEATLTVAVTA